MGRPVNKRYFGNGTGDQIKVRAKIGENAEGDGMIVRQRGTKKFVVTVGANTGACTLVNKSTGALAANEMIVNVRTDAGTIVQATKLYNRTVQAEDMVKYVWTFEAIATDGAVDILDVEDTVFAVINFTTDVVDSQMVAGAASFTVAVTVVGGGTASYQWQENVSGVFTDVEGATTATLALTGLTDPADVDREFRVAVNSPGAFEVVSATGKVLAP
jgi:hypothetical protein